MDQPTDPLVKAALQCLNCLYIKDRFTAAGILRHWTHFDQLSNDQILEILSRFPSRGRA